MPRKGLSPAIGVILMVAVTVSLVALVTFTVLNVPDGTGNSQISGLSVETSQTSQGLQTTVLRNGNADQLVIQGPNGKEVPLNSSSGSVETLDDGAGQYEVIAVTNDGAAQVVTTTEIEESSEAANARTATFTQLGSVSINPPIEDAIVKSVEDGVVIDTARTDSNGEYSIGASEDSNIIVVVDGFDDSQITGTLYASAKENANTDGSVDFDFDESSSDNININGNNLLISYYVDSSVKEIGTPEQLQAIDKITNGLSPDYEIVDDINLSESSNINEFNPIGSSSNPFEGSIDGNGRTIKNLEISNSSENNTGLLKYTSGSNIRNLNIKDPDIVGNHSTGVIVGNSTSSTKIKDISIIDGEINGDAHVGGLVGSKSSGSIINVSSSTAVKSNNDTAGGIIGYSSATIKESESSGSINGTDDVGGLVGDNRGRVENSRSLATINGEEDVGGLVGEKNAGDIVESFATGDVSGTEYVGGLVGRNSEGAVINSNSSIDISAHSEAGGLVGINYGRIDNSYATGQVTGEYDTGGLVGDNKEGNIENSYATGDVKGDFDIGGLAGISEDNIVDSNASGSVEGNSDVGGLVGDSNDGDIIDSYATGYVNGDEHVGGLVGLSSEGLITNSYSSGDISAPDDVGGLIGINYGNINNSYATGEVTGEDDIGGLVGDSNDGQTIKNSYATGNVNATGFDVGGLVGVTEGDIEDSNASGDVEGDGDIGGLVGDSNDGQIIKNSYATGDINGADDVGGLVGVSNSDITDSNASGNVNGYNSIGGLIGRNYGIVDNTYATGEVNGENNIGGLVGESDSGATIKNSYATGNVEATESGVGGLVGLTEGDIENSNASGNVNGEFRVGGLVGYSIGNKVIKNSYATGDVETGGTGLDVGGLVGESEGEIEDSYASGNVSGDDRIGGLAGDFESPEMIKNSYATGNVEAAGGGVGGLAGDMGDVSGNDTDTGVIIKNSYATGDIKGTGSAPGNGRYGGLVGESRNSKVIKDSYATGDVESTGPEVGGLIGSGSKVKNSYATGSVSGNNKTGGLAGVTKGITNSYATGSVSGNNKVGGLAGVSRGQINKSYTFSDVSGNNKVGGLVGKNGRDNGYYVADGDGILEDAYWNKDVSVNNAIGKENPGDSVTRGEILGLTTNEMRGSGVLTTMSGLNYAKVWKSQSSDYPIFRDEPVVLVENGDIINTGESNILNIDQVSGQDSESQKLTTSEFEITDEDNGKVKYTGNNGIYSENDVSFGFTYKIESVQQLQNIQNNLTADYEIVNDIDASDTQNWNTTSNKQVTESGYGSPLGLSSGVEFKLHYSIKNVISVSDENGALSNTTVNADEGIIRIDESSSSRIDVTYEIQPTNKGFEPIGSFSNRFSGSLDGNGHTISGLYMNRPLDNYVGMLGYADKDTGTQTIKDLKLTNIDVNGGSYVGGVVGDIRSSTGRILNVSVSGNIVGESGVGGIAGRNYGKTIEESDSNGLIKSTASGTEFRDRNIGGLVGYNSDGNILSSHSNADINTRGDGFGGLIGEQTGGKINNSYATGDITAPSKYDTTEYIGGLVGIITNSNTVVKNTYSTGDIIINANTGRYIGGIAGSSSGKINNTYSISNISGSTETSGGLVGLNDVATAGDRSYAVVKNSYHKGDIGGSDELGGIAGENRGLINKTYSTGIVTSSRTSSSYVGGLVGKQGKHGGDLGVLEDSYWNSEDSQSKSIGNVGESDAIINGKVSGLTTNEMQGNSASTNMGTLDFTNTWKTVTNPTDNYPMLRD